MGVPDFGGWGERGKTGINKNSASYYRVTTVCPPGGQCLPEPRFPGALVAGGLVGLRLHVGTSVSLQLLPQSPCSKDLSTSYIPHL